MNRSILWMACWIGLSVPCMGRGGAGEMQGPAGYHLVFSDDFSKPGLPDSKRWGYETDVWRNHEAQAYTDRKTNVRVEDGHLTIEARHEETPREKQGGMAAYSSGSLYSKESWTYGHFEICAKVPVARGTWPAIWLLGDSTQKENRWPRCGEIDVMEEVGFDPKHVHQTIHTGAYNYTKHNARGSKTEVADLATAYHVYTLDWTPEELVLSVDGKKRLTYPNEQKGREEWPFDQPQHLKLNLAVGGEWGGQKGIDAEAFPQFFEVKYVRVYQKDGTKGRQGG